MFVVCVYDNFLLERGNYVYWMFLLAIAPSVFFIVCMHLLAVMRPDIVHVRWTRLLVVYFLLNYCRLCGP
jgi:hypothetical protein